MKHLQTFESFLNEASVFANFSPGEKRAWEWAENKINNFNGIGCIIDKKSNKLVVVDKF